MENIHLAAVNIGGQFFSNGGMSASYFGRGDLLAIGPLVSRFLQGSFMVAGLILLFYILLSGIGIMGSAGKDDPKTTAQAKATLTTALIGFIVVILAYSIVTLIGNLLGFTGII